MALNNTYSVEGFDITDGKNRYMYALRRNDDGDLYVARVDLNDSNDSLTLFNIPAPEELEYYTGESYFSNRDPVTHELTYDPDHVVYEQWTYDSKLMQHYINAEGELVVEMGGSYPPYNPDSLVTNTAGALLTPFTFTLYGNNASLNLRKFAIQKGWNGLSEIVITNEGYIGSDNIYKPAILIDGSFPNGITFINNNTVIGAAGFTTVEGEQIEPGDAIEAKVACDIINGVTGTIDGGQAPWTGGTDGYAIRGISNVTLTDTGTIGYTI